MYTEEDLQSAVAAGVLSADAATALRTHVAEQKNTAPADEEHFQLVTGFNDIFVVIAAGLLLISVGWIGTSIVPWLGPLAATITSWGLAEYFVRIKRMALPAIFLLLAFVSAVFMFCMTLLGDDWVGHIFTVSCTAIFAACLHWQRFKVPITIATGAALAISSLSLVVVASTQLPEYARMLIIFIAGVTCLAYAMYWDASDRQRLTRRSDVAFWLHLVAAPTIVHSIFTQFTAQHMQINNWQALLIFLLYALISLVSIVLDRRALMVSALGYVLYAFTNVLKEAGVVSLGFALTALVVGSALLVLSAFWHQSRSWIVRKLPAKLQARVPVLR